MLVVAGFSNEILYILVVAKVVKRNTLHTGGNQGFQMEYILHTGGNQGFDTNDILHIMKINHLYKFSD